MSNRYVHLAVAAVVFVVGLERQIAHAVPPPPGPFADGTWHATLGKPPTTGLQMGALSVVFEKTTLAMVLAAAGGGTIAHQGDASKSSFWLCFAVAKAGHGERIWFNSRGEMGGSNHLVTSVDAEIVGSEGPTADCPALPSSLVPLAFRGFLWLGSKEINATRIFGSPSHGKGEWRAYEYQGVVAGKCEPRGFDVMNWFDFAVRDGSLVAIHAGQLTSC
jgi:hypothetical protein